MYIFAYLLNLYVELYILYKCNPISVIKLYIHVVYMLNPCKKHGFVSLLVMLSGICLNLAVALNVAKITLCRVSVTLIDMC